MQTIMQIPGFSDNIFTHLLAGLGAGFFAVCIGSPLDVVYISSLLGSLFLLHFLVVKIDVEILAILKSGNSKWSRTFS